MTDLPLPAPLPATRLLDVLNPATRSGCTLFDAACHAQNALWEAWSGLGLWQAVIVLGLLAIVLGALRGFLGLVRGVAGWPGVAGAVAIVAALILAFLPRPPRPRGRPPDKPARPRGPFRFGVDRPAGSRTYNPDTNTWEPKR